MHSNKFVLNSLLGAENTKMNERLCLGKLSQTLCNQKESVYKKSQAHVCLYQKVVSKSYYEFYNFEDLYIDQKETNNKNSSSS